MIALTGGNGFLGGELAETFLGAGKPVRILSRALGAEHNIKSAEKTLEYVQADLTRAGPEKLAEFLEGVETLHHLAGMVSRKEEDGPRMMDLHVEGTRKLLNAALKAGVKRVVLLSTSGTVGISEKTDYLADDDSPYAVDIASKWTYYMSKIYQEKLALGWAKEHNRELIALRPSLVLGPGDKNYSSTGDVLKFLRKQIPSVPSGGLSFVDVRDVARAALQASELDFEGLAGNPRTYLLGSANWNFFKFFAQLEAVSGVPGPRMQINNKLALVGAKAWSSRLNPLRGIMELDPIDVDMAGYHWYIDSSKAIQDLRLEFLDPAETLRDTVGFIRGRNPELN